MTNDEFFKVAEEKGIKNIQVAETTQNIGQIELINNDLETFDISNHISYQIKAEYNDKTVKSKSEYLDESVLDDLIMKAKLTDTSYQDDYLQDTTNNNSLDENIDIELSEDLVHLRNLDKLRKEYPELTNLTLSYSEIFEKKKISNNNKVNIETSSHYYEFSPEVIIKNAKEINSFTRTFLGTKKENIINKENLKETIEMAIKQVTKEQKGTKKYNIIIDSSVMSTILSSFVDMISATNVRQNISCLKEKINKKIFSDKLSIIEDPLNKDYPGYTVFDDEGTKTYKKDIVKNGKLMTYLYNIKEAKEANCHSTGNGYSGISTKNMYIKAGTKSLTELFKDLDNGIYITDCMGSMETAINCNTGNISLQTFGFVIENGKIKCGLKPSIMTTTIFELFGNVEEISNEVIFTERAVASPCIYFKDISITGSQESDN